MGTKKTDESAVKADAKPEKAKGGKKEASSDLSLKPPKPSREDFDEKKKVVDSVVEELRKELQKYTTKITECQYGKEDFDTQKEECYARLTETRQAIDDLKQKKDDLQQKLRMRKQQQREAQKETNDLKKDMKELNEQNLEDRIAEIEYRMNVDSMSLAEEKKLMVEIKALKAKRPEVQKKAKKLEELQAAGEGTAVVDGEQKTTEEELTEVKKELDEWIKKRDEQKEDINALKAEREKQTGPIKEYIDARNSVKEKLTEQQNKLKGLWDEFKAAQRIYNEWDKKQRELQKSKLEEERARADELWFARQAKEELEKGMEKPFFEEISNLEQTIAFCKGFLNDDEDMEAVDPEEAKAEKKEKLDGFVQGATVMLSKKDRDADMYFEGKKGKKGKKMNKAQKAKPKTITHTAATFKIFSELKVSAPMTVDDIPAVLTKLNASLEEYNEKIQEWETKTAKRLEELKVAEEKIKKLEEEEEARKAERKAEQKQAEAAASEEE